MIAISLLTIGCRTHRAKTWSAYPPSPVQDEFPFAISLIAFGDIHENRRIQNQVSTHVRHVVHDASATGKIPILLWLGNLSRLKTCSEVPQNQPRLQEFARNIQARSEQRIASFAVLGADDWRCDPESFFQTNASGQLPWVMPSYNYVVRVLADGTASVVSQCTSEQCTLASIDTSSKVGVELIMLDSTSWHQKFANGTKLAQRSQKSLNEQQFLLREVHESWRQHPEIVRILVRHHPIESAGPHGQGGKWPDSAFYLAPPSLQELLAQGVFQGVISAHDRSLQVANDISNAIKRSSRAWIQAPVFQVIAGATAKPDGRLFAGSRSWLFFQGQSLTPEILSTHAGFAEVLLSTSELTLRVHARSRGRWQYAQTIQPLHPPPHPAETASPGMEPCVQCVTGQRLISP